ncbi:MAG: restriction endonuclease subunit S [Acidobacteria bacterium]|nr:restriction endonuclease subunit S [Acidobacteriota bacterium]
MKSNGNRLSPDGPVRQINTPANWRVQRLKTVAAYFVSNVDKHTEPDEQPVRLCNYTDVYYNEFIHAGMELMSATATSDEIRRFRLMEDDIVITKDSEEWKDIAVPALVVESSPDLVCGYHLAVVRPNKHLLTGEFLLRAFQSGAINHQFRVASTGVTRYGLPKEAIGSALILLPPIDKQRWIAAYLSAKLGRLDELISKKERQLALLGEKRQALISHAVTRGLNPEAPTKPSGFPWLGEIPAHWKLKRLKFVAGLQSGLAKGKDWGKTETIDLPYLRVANVQDGFVDLSEIKTLTVGVREANQYLLRKGDVLMNEGGDLDKLGRGTVWEGQIEPCLHQNHVFAIRPKRVDPYWLAYLTRSSYSKAFFMQVGKQTTNLASVSASNLVELPVTLPPTAEMWRIRTFLDSRMERLERLETSLRTQTGKLREYRQALITAAVTGQLSVPEEVA